MTTPPPPAGILAPEVAGYLAAGLAEPDALCARLREEATRERLPIAAPQTARLLELLVLLTRPERVLEVGTAIGYSAVRMGRALLPWGSLETIEKDLDMAARAEKNLEEAGLLGRSGRVLRGAALEVLPRLSNRYDMVFLDADKEGYEAQLTLALPLMPKGALLVADNLLWGGRVASGDREEDPPWRRQATSSLRRFNEALLSHPELSAQILPVGDGVGLAVRR